MLRLRITQAEVYDSGSIDNIFHYFLYDLRSKVAVEITAEVKQAPLLSAVEPYKVIMDTNIIEGLVNGSIKIICGDKKYQFPCITGFEQEELTGQDYTKLRESMIALRDAQISVKEREGDVRKYCLEAKLVNPQEE